MEAGCTLCPDAAPSSGLVMPGENANSFMLALALMIAPASRRARVTGASRLASLPSSASGMDLIGVFGGGYLAGLDSGGGLDGGQCGRSMVGRNPIAIHGFATLSGRRKPDKLIAAFPLLTLILVC